MCYFPEARHGPNANENKIIKDFFFKYFKFVINTIWQFLFGTSTRRDLKLEFSIYSIVSNVKLVTTFCYKKLPKSVQQSPPIATSFIHYDFSQMQPFETM